MPPKGDFEVVYGGPWGGVDYSKPINTLEQNSLAPGTVNTQQINGFLSSSPWVAAFSLPPGLAPGEFPMGMFDTSGPEPNAPPTNAIIVTNRGVWAAAGGSGGNTGTIFSAPIFAKIYTWSPTLSTRIGPGDFVSFFRLNTGIDPNQFWVFVAGLQLDGIYAVNLSGSGIGPVVKATGYVSAAYITELGGRLVAAQCRFPTGGGPGNTAVSSATIAWSGSGIFGNNWDGNPVHDVWNPANQAFFNGNVGGFNQLDDISSNITGLSLVGRSVIIHHLNGLTQQDPNSSFQTSGIQPYVWYHLWNSSPSVGTIAGTVCQYGQTVIFVSTDDVYSLSLGSGLQAIGSKIIPKINADRRAIEQAPGIGFKPFVGNTLSFWYCASYLVIAGQLHYVLQFSFYTTTPPSPFSAQNTNTIMYDFNLKEASWSIVDFSKYFQQRDAGAGFLMMSCALVQTSSFGTYDPLDPSGIILTSTPRFIMIGVITSVGTLSNLSYSGNLLQLVPFDYDFLTNWLTAFDSVNYVPVSIPQTTIYFRAEMISLGHKITVRRLRIQSDNAPIPTATILDQQTAIVSFNGSTSTPVTPPNIAMQGNFPSTGGIAMQTYYADGVLTDDMVQASITGLVNPDPVHDYFRFLPAFRLSTVSLIGTDSKGTTQ